MKRFVLIITLCGISFGSFAQKPKDTLAIQKIIIDPLKPSRAAFYSAIVPGLGQAYNKKYWKIPVVYAALGTTVYFYIDNNNKYHRYRTAFKLREAGKQDEFTLDNGTEILSRDVLIRGQERYRKDRDLSILLTVVVYALQVVEASVNAHLLNHNTDRDLSIRPQIIHNYISNTYTAGIHLNFQF